MNQPVAETTAGFQQPVNGVQVGLDGRVSWFGWCRIFEEFAHRRNFSRHLQQNEGFCLEIQGTL